MVTPSSEATIRSAINSLRTEQSKIERAVEALEGLLGSGPSAKPQAATIPKARQWSAAARKAASQRSKAMWAKRAAPKKTKRKMSAAARKALSEKLKAVWAAKRQKAA